VWSIPYVLHTCAHVFLGAFAVKKSVLLPAPPPIPKKQSNAANMSSEASAEIDNSSGTKRTFEQSEDPPKKTTESNPPESVPSDPTEAGADLNKKARTEDATDVSDVSGKYQEHSMKVVVPNTKVGSVIGKGGSIIKFIRESTKAQVNVSSAIPGQQDRVVTITGTQEATQKAFNLIQAKVSEDEGPSGGGEGGGGGYDNSYLDVQPGEIVVRQLIPAVQCGPLIGKRGANIAMIRSQSGAKVKIASTPEPGTTERMITIIGTLLQCQFAQQLISQKLLETAMNEPGASHTASAYGASTSAYGTGAYAGAYGTADPYGATAYGQGMMGGAMGTYMADPQQAYQQAGGMVGYGAASGGQTTTQEITLPDDAMGRVIGRQGSNINEIRTVSGCQIQVVPKDGISPMRRVTLTGTAEQIASATLMIQRMT